MALGKYGITFVSLILVSFKNFFKGLNKLFKPFVITIC